MKSDNGTSTYSDRATTSTRVESPLHLGACCEIVRLFVCKALGADEFLPRFFAMWRDIRVDASGLKTHGAELMLSGPYGVLASINGLCVAYSNSLAPSRGYRVSEEQFRKEVQSLALTESELNVGVF